MHRPSLLPARHALRAAVLGALVALGAALPAAPAMAAAPMAKAQAPGFFRLMVGQVEVTALNDGTVDLPVDQLLQQPADKTRQAVAAEFLKVPTETSFNAFLVNTGSKLVLVDAGAGGLFGPTVGGLVNALRAAGYQPEQVDEVLITHLHPDHVGGLSRDGQRVFPNATVHAGARDLDYWLSTAQMEKAPKEAQGFFQGAMASLSPYQKAGRVHPLTTDAEIVPGVRAQAANGHTPGHTVYVVESQGQKLVLVGDLIHVGAVQFAHPEVTIGFDTDAKAAEAARAKVFAQAARDGAWVGAAHIAFPGIGHLKPAGSGYDWVPANWTLNR